MIEVRTGKRAQPRHGRLVGAGDRVVFEVDFPVVPDTILQTAINLNYGVERADTWKGNLLDTSKDELLNSLAQGARLYFVSTSYRAIQHWVCLQKEGTQDV
jgi:hypothetical protein